MPPGPRMQDESSKWAGGGRSPCGRQHAAPSAQTPLQAAPARARPGGLVPTSRTTRASAPPPAPPSRHGAAWPRCPCTCPCRALLWPCPRPSCGRGAELMGQPPRAPRAPPRRDASPPSIGRDDAAGRRARLGARPPRRPTAIALPASCQQDQSAGTVRRATCLEARGCDLGGAGQCCGAAVIQQIASRRGGIVNIYI